MPYFPNASDPRASRFENDCSECKYGEDPCPVALVLMVHNYDQSGNEKLEAAMDLLIDPDSGSCKMKELIDSKRKAGAPA